MKINETGKIDKLKSMVNLNTMWMVNYLLSVACFPLFFCFVFLEIGPNAIIFSFHN